MTDGEMQDVRESVQVLLGTLGSPERAAYAFDLMAQAFRESAAELEAAWQDETAGRCWNKAARHLDHATASLLAG